jgi:hypothetical protein
MDFIINNIGTLAPAYVGILAAIGVIYVCRLAR